MLFRWNRLAETRTIGINRGPLAEAPFSSLPLIPLTLKVVSFRRVELARLSRIFVSIRDDGTPRSDCLRAFRRPSELRTRQIARSLQPPRGLAGPRPGCDREGFGRTPGCSARLRSLRVCTGRRDRTAPSKEGSPPHP